MEVRNNTNMWIRPALEVAWKQQNMIVCNEFWPSQFAKLDVSFCLAHVTISVVNVQVEDSCH